MDNYSKLILPKNLPTSPTEKRTALDQIESQAAKLHIDDLIQERRKMESDKELLGAQTAALIRGFLNGFRRSDYTFLKEIHKALVILHDRPDKGEEDIREWFKSLISKSR